MISDRVIFITGGTGKIGQILIEHFLNKGDTVATTSRSQESFFALQKKHDKNAKLIGIMADFTQPDSISHIIEFLNQRKINPECLINNARNIDFLNIANTGIIERKNFIGELLVDVIAPYELTMALAMSSHKFLKRVINISSQYGLVAANPNLYDDHVLQSPLHYSVAKSAVIQLTRELAVRLAKFEIQVNCVAFGGIEGRVSKEFQQRYSKLCPMGRMLKDEEVIGAIDMLSSDACSGMTGHTLVVDGGWSIW